jgi:hypothetical protein
MRKALISFILGFLIIALLYSKGYSEDVKTFMEGFYDELADIIERNMNSPEQCVAEVERCYENNKEKLSQFMEEAKRSAASQGISIEQKASLMTEEEIKEIMQNVQTSKLFQIMFRFNQVLENFSRIYPQHALKIIEKIGGMFELGS